jgi:molecular chaperone GrpE
LFEVLRKRGVETFDVVGKDFDPQWHEAVVQEPADGHRDQEIIGEVRRGYRLGSRLLRPAMVRVAKA